MSEWRVTPVKAEDSGTFCRAFTFKVEGPPGTCYMVFITDRKETRNTQPALREKWALDAANKVKEYIDATG